MKIKLVLLALSLCSNIFSMQKEIEASASEIDQMMLEIEGHEERLNKYSQNRLQIDKSVNSVEFLNANQATFYLNDGWKVLLSLDTGEKKLYEPEKKDFYDFVKTNAPELIRNNSRSRDSIFSVEQFLNKGIFRVLHDSKIFVFDDFGVHPKQYSEVLLPVKGIEDIDILSNDKLLLMCNFNYDVIFQKHGCGFLKPAFNDIVLYDYKTHQVVKSYKTDNNYTLVSHAFNKDRTKILIGYNKKFILVDLETKEEKAVELEEDMFNISFVSDDIICCFSQNRLFFYEVKSLMHTLNIRAPGIRNIAFYDNTLLLWLPKGNTIIKIPSFFINK